MATSKKSRRAAGLAAVAVVAATALSSEVAAFADQRTGILADAVTLAADFEDGIAAKASGGTVIPVTVTGGSVGDTAQAFSALRITAKIGGVTAPVAWVDGSHLKVTAPATVKAAATTMRLFKNGVAGPESSDRVGYLPIVNSVAPSVVNAAGGATVTVTGAGFLGVDAGDASAVTFGGTNATSFTVVSASRITAVVPAGLNGPATVRVSSTGGESPIVLGSKVSYRAALGVSGDPVAKFNGGPTILTITGAGLGANAKAFAAERVTVLVGTRSVTASYVDSTRVKVTMPAATTATVPVKVMHDGIAGEAATVTMVPVVTGLSAPSDALAGGKKVTVKVAGLKIADATGFKFGDNPATCEKKGIGTAVTFLCTVPPAGAPGPVTVSFLDGENRESRFTAAATFSYTVN
ncbi:IPT/TIG domain-containing protein [Actinoplanes sp. NPDC023801]|uniref:IPT/TIG domain-containing protein n=1 Tax=Actinoplanes sp. NPDC023801 TaxID=3154595 RepID=UPI0033FAF994